MLGTFNSALTFKDNDPSQVQVVRLSGSSFGLFGLSSSPLHFGRVPVGGTSSPRTVTLVNRRSQPISMFSISVGGDSAPTNCCPSSLAAGQSCVVSVVFHPTVNSERRSRRRTLFCRQPRFGPVGSTFFHAFVGARLVARHLMYRSSR
jgi:hypothetical protein